MSCRYDVDDRAEYLQIVPTGRICSLEELTEHANKIFTYAIQYDKRSILVDERNFVLGVSLVDIIDWIDSLTEKKIFYMQLQVAVLPNSLMPQTVYNDFEVFLQSRRYAYKVFNDISAALSWLKNPHTRVVGRRPGIEEGSAC